MTRRRVATSSGVRESLEDKRETVGFESSTKVLDPRLLRRIFEGPHEAYWADAKIGSHIGIGNDPDIYDGGCTAA